MTGQKEMSRIPARRHQAATPGQGRPARSHVHVLAPNVGGFWRAASGRSGGQRRAGLGLSRQRGRRQALGVALPHAHQQGVEIACVAWAVEQRQRGTCAVQVGAQACTRLAATREAKVSPDRVSTGTPLHSASLAVVWALQGQESSIRSARGSRARFSAVLTRGEKKSRSGPANRGLLPSAIREVSRRGRGKQKRPPEGGPVERSGRVPSLLSRCACCCLAYCISDRTICDIEPDCLSIEVPACSSICLAVMLEVSVA